MIIALVIVLIGGPYFLSRFIKIGWSPDRYDEKGRDTTLHDGTGTGGT